MPTRDKIKPPVVQPSREAKVAMLRGAKPILPIWVGETRRCFGCGKRPGANPPIDEELIFRKVTIRFVVCETCVKAGLDVQHARRVYVWRLKTFQTVKS